MSKEVVKEIQQILFDNGFRSGAKLERAAGTRYKSAKEIETVIANIERQARLDEWNLISETLHSAGIQAELFLNKTRKDRIKELEREE